MEKKFKKKLTIGLLFYELRLGGAVKHLFYLAQYLQRQGHQVVIFSASITKDCFPELTKNLDIRVLPKKINQPPLLPKTKLKIYWTIISYNWRKFISFVQMIIREPIDIYNAYDYPADLVAAGAKLITHKPVVYTLNDIWHIPGFQLRKDKRRYYRFVQKTFFWWLERLAVKILIDQVIVLSQWAKEVVKRAYGCSSQILAPGLEGHIYQKLPNPEIAREKNKLANVFTFLYLGILLPHRRLEDFIWAFEKLSQEFSGKPMQLIIAGSPQASQLYSQKIKQLAKKAKGKIILKFKEFSEKQVFDLLVSTDVFVFPAEYQTWGMTVIEAMACGKPCIVADKVGAAQMISHGKTGLIFGEKQKQDLYEQMKKLFSNKNLCLDIGREARRAVIKKVSWEKYAKETEKIYKSLL